MKTNIKIINHIVGWLKNYSKKSNTNGFVVGLSGGIDSTLTSCLLAETNKKTLCLSMPIFQSEEELNRVKELKFFLKKKYSNIEFMEIDLTDIFSVFKKTNEKTNEKNIELPLANSRARLRMTTLYYYAGLYNFLVVGTGNKIEDFGIGFFTKYGDGGVDINPIADLFKSEVYSLAKEFNIPKSILECAPTDGLFGDTRTDEQQIGASYNELEWAMKYYKNNKTKSLTKRQKEVLKIYSKRHNDNKHKFSTIPVCKITDIN